MGKYMRKAKTAGEVALMEVSQSSLGVRTRAKTLALQGLQKSAVAAAAANSSSGGGSYLQLRSRRLEKPPIFVSRNSKRQRQNCVQKPNPNPNSRTSSRLGVGGLDSGSVDLVSLGCLEKEGGCLEAEKVEGIEETNQDKNNNDDDEGIEASFGENVVEFEGRERSTRESTPCSLIRDPDSIRTPGSTTRPTSSIETNRRLQNSMLRHIPTAHEMDEFFAGAEAQQQRQFIEKYNFDPVNDVPLPGRYEWTKPEP